METMAGEALTVRKNGTAIDGARVVKELQSCNGNMAVVPSVLFSLCKGEGSKGVMEVAHEAGLRMFTEAMWRAKILEEENLGQIGEERGLYTILAPTDGAFEGFLRRSKFGNFSEFLESKKLRDIMQKHVLKGHRHMGFYERTCHDLAIPEGVIDFNQTVNCEELANIGFCGNDWIASGYCRKSCGRCKAQGKGQVETHFTIHGSEVKVSQSSMDAEDQLEIFSDVKDEQAPKDSLKVKIQNSIVLVPDIKACNGLVNIIDKVVL